MSAMQEVTLRAFALVHRPQHPDDLSDNANKKVRVSSMGQSQADHAPPSYCNQQQNNPYGHQQNGLNHNPQMHNLSDMRTPLNFEMMANPSMVGTSQDLTTDYHQRGARASAGSSRAARPGSAPSSMLSTVTPPARTMIPTHSSTSQLATPLMNQMRTSSILDTHNHRGSPLMGNSSNGRMPNNMIGQAHPHVPNNNNNRPPSMMEPQHVLDTLVQMAHLQ
ncbi:uncharacterized protein MELLADRAFT_115354 [Melampsora larici-populina 98AG31]|uniref:Uncharacterized protein n=1 Tax=Melampsora larici-populina (strain 98AG31 / pathotype 3-4-7) TaxID=747676 RepID=F4R9D5_MELLP|nr:uncharacterized protein MELLADRAFT_115354 [Melampsora larici-populina 98AG31]EGG10967.1 hypothetical protein MELLADRAFT_115354 [Melampsora larici-populina 98AG31]